MAKPNSTPPTGEQPHPHLVPNLVDDAFDAPDSEAMDELSEETGIDLTDASALDADNVPADEETDRVVQAPD